MLYAQQAPPKKRLETHARRSSAGGAADGALRGAGHCHPFGGAKSSVLPVSVAAGWRLLGAHRGSVGGALEHVFDLWREKTKQQKQYSVIQQENSHEADVPRRERQLERA